MVCASPFGGPRLEQLAQFPAWQPAFLAAASAANCASYYLVEGYEDPDHANAIGPATMHMLMAAADSAVPDVDDHALSDVGLQVAVARRARRVQRRVVEAIVNEVETMHQRAVRHASQFLLAALAPALHAVVRDASSPYHMWLQLCRASRHGLHELYALYTPATTATIDAPASVDNVQRAMIDPFLDAVLPPTMRSEWTAATTAAVAEFAAETRAKLGMVLLTHAAADAVPDATTFEHENWNVAEFARFLAGRVARRPPPPLTHSPRDVPEAVTDARTDAPEVPLHPEGTATPVVDVEPEIEAAPVVSEAHEPIHVLEEASTSAGNTVAFNPVLPLEDEVAEPTVKPSLDVPAPPVAPATPEPTELPHMTVTPLDAPAITASATTASSTAFVPVSNASATSVEAEIASPPVAPEPKELPRLTPSSTPLVILTPPAVPSAPLQRIPNDIPALTANTERFPAAREPAAEAIDLCSPASTPEYAAPLDSVEVKTELLAPPVPIVPVRVTHVRRPSLSHAVTAAPQPSRPTSSEPVVTKIQGVQGHAHQDHEA
ncbi:hypothetical protein SPRG_16458 [Saprolegnia parasitica CBS 223.65]|uniref:Uncharacterized protein n=1 Tax=Saprolegnia parasitica (strain CBS 223.65) TaxID=695850 RepID=A0A067BU14_SAPPC|nr:hypothetical protein SPRG_16458 [Saprolegnia parasitica CBS 223.65]KDO18117.1 hypothetical protein SPRG_16458 [Saprolegnia parasitica CBS 223.65]|eukprot:XP_012211176.1 hypothetical protein SPRG_16458 [Saprolegnia parasitica CBS 223.65]